MIKTTMYCDRCKKECEKNVNNHGYHVVRVRSGESLDLCQKCYDGLCDWVNSVKMKDTQTEDDALCDNCSYKTDTCQEGLHCPMDEYKEEEMTKEEESFNRTIKVTYDDCISRKAMIDYIYNDLGLGDEENGQDVARMMELASYYRQVKSLPPVTSAEKVGHWIANGETFRCSKCGELACCQGRYCNECGAKMQEVDE